jgi:patatin-like phospholipase/acyl hydrolase
MKKILSLSGGGIRGLITLKILCRIEEDLGISIAETFDLYVGTSIGSILTAALLSNHQRTARQLLDACDHQTLSTFFPWSYKCYLYPLAPGSKYPGTGKRSVIDKWLPDITLNDLNKPVCFPVFDITKGHPVVLNNITKGETPLRFAVDACSAAMTYFPAVQSPLTGDWYCDGGTVANNPCMIGITEGSLLWKCGIEQFAVLSIGTGYVRRKINGASAVYWGAIGWLRNGLIDMIMDAPVDEVVKQCNLLLGHQRFLHVDGDLSKYGFETEIIDDISVPTIEKLLQIGDSIYDEHKDQIAAFFSLTNEK